MSIIDEAKKISGHGERAKQYGSPKVNFRRIAEIWSIQLEKKLRQPITSREVALLMISMKLAREINAPKRDSIVDIVGYCNCIDIIDNDNLPVT